jgi:hypothetical protein
MRFITNKFMQATYFRCTLKCSNNLGECKEKMVKDQCKYLSVANESSKKV